VYSQTAILVRQQRNHDPLHLVVAQGGDSKMSVEKDSDGREAGSAAKLFSGLANRTSQAAGRASTFAVAVAVVARWGVTGPIFGFSDTWQLIINTGTTIVTFLMVFLIQNSQNRDSAAIQVKLDELIRAGKAQNSFVGIEHLTDEELAELRAKCEARAKTERAAEKSVRRAGRKSRRAAEKAVTE
jgi:low affinity Fe/Cu permease